MYSSKVIDPAAFTGNAPAYRVPPHNEEAEQTVLGAILVNNKAFEKVGEFLRPEHFFDPANQKIYQAILKMIDRGQVANPITLKAYFEQDRDLSEIGGPAYLARLAAAIVTVHNLEDYGRVIHDSYLRRQLIEVGEDMVNQAYRHDMEAPAASLLADAERALFVLSEVGTAERRAVSVADASGDYLNDLESVWKSDGRLNGITTGLNDLDRRLGGMKPGQLVILAGRPSMGKTALATNIAESAAQAGHPVFFVSLEMSRKELLDRLVAGRTGIPSSALNGRNLSPVQKRDVAEAMAELSVLPLHIDDQPARTVTSLRNALRRHKRRHGLDLAVIDYVGLMNGESRRGGGEANRVQEISEITRGLKAIAKELEVPVLALSQLSRAVEQREDKRPQLSDLRDSGSIEQDADVVMFVFREQYYLERAEPSRRPDESQEKFNARHAAWQARCDEVFGTGDVIIGKLRQGEIGTVTCAWDGRRQRLSDLYRGA